jgi:RNA polymerase sigma factor (sigma-70 family)
VTEPQSDEGPVWEELPATLVRAEPHRLRSALPFDVFYARELTSLVCLARALSGSAAAEDIAQEAMIAAYRRWREIEQYDVPAAWVRRVCANLATSSVRRRAVEARALLRAGGLRQTPTELEPRDEEFWSEVRRLPRRQAQALSLHYVYDLGVSEIALTLGCSESSVKAHLVRGRARLADRLGTGEGRRP